MKVRAIRTRRVEPGKDRDLFAVLDESLPKLQEGTVVAVTSKIAAICEGRFVPYQGERQKEEVIKNEAEYYLPRSSGRYNVLLTVKGGGLTFSSGVDESNSAGFLVLWPKNPQKLANRIREHLAKKRGLKKIGVVLTDTTSVPLRWGQRGVFAVAHSGFKPLKPYIGKKDLFGRKFEMTSAAIADALATAAVLVMGEGAEQTPLAVMEDLPFVEFQDRNPAKKELKELEMPLEDDLFAPLLTAVKWRKGGSA